MQTLMDGCFFTDESVSDPPSAKVRRFFVQNYARKGVMYAILINDIVSLSSDKPDARDENNDKSPTAGHR
ncbi:MAG TPA: hypothetical protein IAA35_05640, partial [Candidatus Alistipes faecigallinarum]|nr:hypothetical protein [Candidatus Alistipes faecigallinarum]